MAPPLSRIEKLFYESMAEIHQIMTREARIEELFRVLNLHMDDLYSDSDDRVFSRTENEYFIQRYQAELLRYGILITP